MEGARLINGVTFGNISCDDLGLILAHRDLGNPKPKTSLIEVPGSSVILDFTEAFGDVQYGSRKISLEFIGTDPWDDHYELEMQARNQLHGKKMQIRFDEDDNYYFVGRISIDSWLYRKKGGEVKMTIDAEPWRYKDTTIELYGKGSTQISLPVRNVGVRNAVPTIYPKATLDVTIGEQSVRISSSVEEYRNNNLFFAPGDNILIYRGANDTDLATMVWTEVCL